MRMRTSIIIFLLSISVCTRIIYAQNVATSTITADTATDTTDSGIANIPPVVTPNGGAYGIPELEEKVSYTVIPEKPQVGDLVSFQADMYGTPVKDAVFTWYLDGKVFSTGQGLNKISIYIQKNSKVSLTIVTVTGNKLTKEWAFNIKDVAIFWEANTYTPPFYKGKSLYTSESTLTLHGINLDSKNPLTNTYANYVWRMDGQVQGDDSGVGKRTFTYQGDILQLEPYFELLYTGVTNYKETNLSKAVPVNTRTALQVQTLTTDILTYEKTPLLGVLFNKKIDTVFSFNKPETTLVAYPAYYSVFSSLIPQYAWSVNDNEVKQNSNFLSFKKTKDNEQSRLTIYIANPKSLLQSKDMTYIIDTTAKNTNSTVGGFGK